MEASQMRSKIKDLYPSVNWKKRVDGMEDNQVMAIYYRALEHGDFDRSKKRYKAQGKQIDIFEYMEGK